MNGTLFASSCIEEGSMWACMCIEGFLGHLLPALADPGVYVCVGVLNGKPKYQLQAFWNRSG